MYEYCFVVLVRGIIQSDRYRCRFVSGTGIKCTAVTVLRIGILCSDLENTEICTE